MTNKALNGIKIFKNDMLPPMTLMASPDLFEKLTDTPEQSEAKHQALLANIAMLQQLVLRQTSKRQCQQPQAHPARCGCEVQL